MENLREAEAEMEDSICRPKYGEILGEEDNERSAEDLMNYWNSSEQLEDMIFQKLEGRISHNLVMQRKEKLLNIVVINYADIRQLLRLKPRESSY